MRLLGSISRRPPTVWLYVRSESARSPNAIDHQVEQNINSLVESLQQSSPFHPTLSVPKFNKEVASSLNSPSTHSSKDIDICQVACVCSHFQSSLSPASSSQQQCLGYLKSPAQSRYVFFGPSAPGNVSLSGPHITAPTEVTTLNEVIDQTQSNRLQLLHQYQLALKISKSVLQFHNTAWLQPTWQSKDLSVLGTDINDQSMNTLHLSTRFDADTVPTTGEAQTSSISTDPAFILDAQADSTPLSSIDACCKKLGPGIYNETLYCLGIVLLEIAHWKTFEKLREGDPDDFYAAHRIVRGPPPLGPKYRKIVERCLRCDFSASSEDLEDVELQRAVWSKVIYPLEALVRDISF
jgi:hypothetical protein